MSTHNQCFRAKKKNIIFFYLKIDIFTAVKYCYILHGRVCVMKRGVKRCLNFKICFLFGLMPDVPLTNFQSCRDVFLD